MQSIYLCLINTITFQSYNSDVIIYSRKAGGGEGGIDKFGESFIIHQPNFYYLLVKSMLNKNSLAVKKVRGQSEATMAISDQNL